jgi:dTMP kinase
MYIVLEGPDGSGTTSHLKLLAEKLRAEGKTVRVTAEPTDGPIGRLIRQQINDHTGMPATALQLLYTADRAQHMEEVVKPALARGEWVISDRNYLSTLAYGEALGLDRQWLARANAPFPKPDLMILALPPFEVCNDRLMARGKRDAMEGDTLQKRVHAAYHTMADENPQWAVVDTSGAMEQAAHAIASKVNAFLQEKERETVVRV